MQQDLRKRSDIEIVPDAPTEPDAFLRWSAERPREEGRYELSRGVVTRTMINVTRFHYKICSNIVGEIGRQLDPEHFDWGSADFGVKTPFGSRNPDVLIAPAVDDPKTLSTDRPIFLAEVLSPSSEDIDFGPKLEEYTAMPSLRTYVIFSQDEPRAWVFAMQPDGTWPAEPLDVAGREGVIPLGGLDISLAMAAVYRGIADRT